MSKRWTLQDIEQLQAGGNVNVPELAPGVKKPVSNIPENIPLTPLQQMQALGRMKAGKMNDTEKAYAERLEWRKHAGEVLWWKFGVINLKIAEECFYRTDFAVLLSSYQFEIHETKGHWTDDALVKVKVAAEMFPFRFVAMQYKKGEWIERNF